MNQRSPQRQSMPRSLVRNEPDEQPRAVVHPPLPAQLPHSGVHRGIAGAPLTPGREPLLGAAPADRPAVARLELGARVGRDSGRSPGRRSRASTAAADRPPRPRRRGGAARPPSARCTRSAGRARGGSPPRRRAGRVPRHSRARRRPGTGAAAPARRSPRRAPGPRTPARGRGRRAPGAAPAASCAGGAAIRRGAPRTSRRGWAFQLR